MKILLSSYSFGANRGSEAGVGWNVARLLAMRGHDVWVATTSEFHHLNMPATQDEDWAPRLHILEWDCGLVDFPLAKTYRLWQKRIKAPLRTLHAQENFDIIHHVTFNQYRGIHDIFHIDIPYLIGPMGGAETVQPIFWKELPLKSRLKELARYVKWDAFGLLSRLKRMRSKGLLLFSGAKTLERISTLGVKTPTALSPIIAIHDHEIVASSPEDKGDYFICAAGGGRPEKGIDLTLRAFSQYRKSGGELRLLIAAVPAEMQEQMRSRLRELDLGEEAVELIAFIPREELLTLMSRARAFLCLNFRDSGCMALLEALALGLPSICFDNDEQFWLPEKFAIKIPLPKQQAELAVLAAMQEAANASPPSEAWHQERVEWLRRDMTWEARVDYIELCYRYLMDTNSTTVPALHSS